MCVCRRPDLRRWFLIRALEAVGALGATAFLPPGAFASELTRVKRVRLSEQGVLSRVEFDLSGPAEHRLFTLERPDRVVIDLARTAVGAPLALHAAPGSLVERLRYATHKASRLRLVLDLRRPMHVAGAILPPGAGHPDYRLVVTLSPEHAVKQASEPALRDVVVVIDPGHGGHDPGAVGRRGTEEKNVVLPISLRLGDTLGREKGFRTVLTRDRDVYLPLRERIRIAAEHQADLFVSIHADASTDRHASGSSVYILSRHGASSERARRVAERENMAGSAGEVKLADKNPMLASVLLDLAQTATINDSAHFADDVIHQLEQVNNLLSRRVERAGFVVLKSPEIPSALVETAFISNPVEERQLRTRAFRDELAGALHRSIRSYLAANAPRGTVLAALREASRA